MKKSILLTLVFACHFAFGQVINRTFESSDGSKKLLGRITPDRLESEPFDGWFNENKASYEVDEASLDGIELPDSITIFMGTWCGDSRREVPRFIKLLESKNFDLGRLNIICLNSGFQNYKQAPEREERGMNIHRVPTFILHDKTGEEIGRIVEEPIQSLEGDLKTIMNGGMYETAYPMAEKVVHLLETYSLRELKRMRSKILDDLSQGKNPYELNTYGYVLWSSFQLPKAQFAFELNTALFPEEAVTHQTLASFLNGLGDERRALTSVKNALKIEPENERLLALERSIRKR